MNLEKYMTITNKKALNRADMQLFNIPNLEKGWKKKYKNNEANDELVYKVINNMSGIPLKKMTRAIRNNQREIRSPERSLGKDLYLMINSIGMLKIGVSQNPEQRARELSNSAGVYISVIGVWKTEDAFSCEKFLHREFADKRLIGEWFSPETTTVLEIDKLVKEKAKLISDKTGNNPFLFNPLAKSV